MTKRMITKSLGKLTPRVWHQLIESAAFVNDNREQLDLAISRLTPRKPERPFFLAEITDSDRITEGGTPDDDVYRWKYAWKEVQPADPADETTHGTLDDVRYAFADVSGGLTSTQNSDAFHHYALNTIEAGNSSGLAGPGVKYTGLDAQGFDSLRPRPIGKAFDGMDGPGVENPMVDVAVIVPMFKMYDPSGGLRFFFSAVNVIDGHWCEND